MQHPFRQSQVPSNPSSPTEDEDAVWALLAECPPPKAAASFVAKTVRAARLVQAPERPAFRTWWIWVPALAASLIAAFALTWPSRPEPSTPVLTEESGGVELLREELHLMTYVDELLTVSDPATLDDAGLAELF